MTPRDGGAILADVLVRRGVGTVFTLCGGHISPVLVGAKARGIAVVDVRHEAAAVFAADALARLSGTPGVAAVTAGPGATNTITALKNAQLAQSPVVLIAGAAPTVLRGRGALQDIDQAALLRPHTKWMRRATRVRDLEPLLDHALTAAQAGVPGPACVECPVDLLYPEPVVREWYGTAGGRAPRSLRHRLERWYLQLHLGHMFAHPTRPPAAREVPAPTIAAPQAVARARDLLDRAQRPVLLVGSQALLDVPRVPDLAQAVQTLGIPTYLSGMARGLLGREHALWLRHRRREALREADLVVLAGVPCDFRLDYGRHIGRGARIVAVNRSRTEARRNRRPAVTAVGDAGQFLRALATQPPDAARWQPWLAQLRARDQARDREIAAQARASGEGVNPIALCRAIEATASVDSVFVLDGGDFAATASYVLAPRGPLRHLDPGVFGTLGVGGGFALGAARARPGAEIWILYGDGAAAFSLAEFDTFVRHGIPVVAVVGNDASWAQIARDQITILGDDVGTVLRRSDYEIVAEGFGGVGLRVTSPDELVPALDRARSAIAAGRPVLLNVWLSPTEFRKGSVSM